MTLVLTDDNGMAKRCSTKAWAKTLDPNGSSGVRAELSMSLEYGTELIYPQIRFLADPNLKFTNALDLAFDGTAVFGGPRSKRYALVVEDGVVKEAHVEPDNTGLDG